MRFLVCVTLAALAAVVSTSPNNWEGSEKGDEDSKSDRCADFCAALYKGLTAGTATTALITACEVATTGFCSICGPKQDDKDDNNGWWNERSDRDDLVPCKVGTAGAVCCTKGQACCGATKTTAAADKVCTTVTGTGATDTSNCGGCNRKCGTNQKCTNGRCACPKAQKCGYTCCSTTQTCDKRKGKCVAPPVCPGVGAFQCGTTTTPVCCSTALPICTVTSATVAACSACTAGTNYKCGSGATAVCCPNAQSCNPGSALIKATCSACVGQVCGTAKTTCCLTSSTTPICGTNHKCRAASG